MAAELLARKYCRKWGVPAVLHLVEEPDVPQWLWRSEPDAAALALLPEAERFGHETDARQIFRRLAGFWTYWGWKGGYFASEADARIFFDEMQRMQALQLFAPNSPQWFNAGLHWAYGINQSGAGYYFVEQDTHKVREADLAYERGFIHSCYIQSIRDDLVRDGGILSFITDEAKIAKFGAGTGANFSALRGSNEPLTSGGTSSGLMAALKTSDRAASLVSVSGSTRQPSKMVLVDIDHPEILDYIDWKVEEERKVAALSSGSQICNRYLREVYFACEGVQFTSAIGDHVKQSPALRQAVCNALAHGIPENAITNTIQQAKQGAEWRDHAEYNADWNSAAYHSVSGQRSNNSVRVSNEFLDAVNKDSDWHLLSRTSGRPVKALKARALWDRVSQAAWWSADPGIQFDTTINDWHTCPQGGRINGSNSCSEFLFLDDTATTLACINLRAVATSGMEINIDAFTHIVRLVTLMMEISVSAALYPSRLSAAHTDAYRPLGIGYTNLGGLLMTAGIPYDSDAARHFCGAVTALMTGLSYRTSAEIAERIGPFRGFAANRAEMLRVMRNHRLAAWGATEGYDGLSIVPVPLVAAEAVNEPLVAAARKAWDEALALGERFGYRNAQASVIAPTGTTSLILDCDTFGIEPDYALVKSKTLAGGGSLIMINRCVPEALRTLGYTQEQIEKICRYVMGTRSLSATPFINEHTLREHGFNDRLIEAAERSVSRGASLESALNPVALGIEECHRCFGWSYEAMARPNFNLLLTLGFNPTDLRLANEHCFGHGTLVGAPYFDSRHLPVFDCSVTVDGDDARGLSIASHLRMMAAAQPFVSGAISKTVNVPSNTDILSCQETFVAARDLGLKAIALYRDGSKLSQPLNSRSSLPSLATIHAIGMVDPNLHVIDHGTDFDDGNDWNSPWKGSRRPQDMPA